MCLLRNKRIFSFIWIANKIAPQISLFFHPDGQLNAPPDISIYYKNRVSLNFSHFGFVLSPFWSHHYHPIDVLSPFWSHHYHPIELIKVQDFSYSFSLGVSHLWLSYSPRQSHLDHTLNAYNALLY
jgi:hypothetical protein